MKGMIRCVLLLDCRSATISHRRIHLATSPLFKVQDERPRWSAAVSPCRGTPVLNRRCRGLGDVGSHQLQVSQFRWVHRNRLHRLAVRIFLKSIGLHGLVCKRPFCFGVSNPFPPQSGSSCTGLALRIDPKADLQDQPSSNLHVHKTRALLGQPRRWPGLRLTIAGFLLNPGPTAEEGALLRGLPPETTA